MNDAFAQLVGPVLHHVIDFQRGLERGEHPALHAERDALLARLDEAEQQARPSRSLAADYSLARYALVTFIDEILINSTWEHALDWKDHILEWDFYRERVGGERFYEKARECESLAGTDPLETYFLCVALGFRGMYASNPADLRVWSARAYARIAAAATQPDRFLPDEPRDDEPEPLSPLPGESVLLAISVLVSASTLLTLAGFLLAVHLSP